MNDDTIRQALRNVIDPELGLDVIELGMVGDIEVDGSAVLINLCLTSMSCPFWDLFVNQVESAVTVVDGVEKVNVQFDRKQPWSPDRMTERARQHLERLGIMPASLRRLGGNPGMQPAELLQISMGALAKNAPAGR